MGRAGGGAARRFRDPGRGLCRRLRARRALGAAGGRMWGRAAWRRCPRGLRRGREALLALLMLLALAALGSVLRARSGAGAPEPGPQRSRRSGRRDPVLPRPPVSEDSLGAHGEAVWLQLQGEELRLQEESLRLHQINIYLSDRISLHRRLPERWNPL